MPLAYRLCTNLGAANEVGVYAERSRSTGAKGVEGQGD
jgi:hypothetical protein